MALIFGALFLTFAVLAFRKDPNSKSARLSLTLLIVANLSAAVHTIIAYLRLGMGDNLEGVLPLHLCDVAAILAGTALITRKPLLCELTYYLGLGGTLQGLLTPNLQYAFPHPIYFSFFHLHLFVVIAALFLPLGLGWRPRTPLPKTLTRIFFFICGYLLTVYAINSILGTNYAFVMHKPDNASLFDHMGPHPWYNLTTLGLVIIALFILSLPFLFKKSPPTKRRAQ